MSDRGPAGPSGASDGEQAATAPPRVERADVLRWGASLQGLARIRQLLSHDLRSRIHGLSLQTDLLAELGRTAAGIPDESRDRLIRYARTMQSEILDLYEATEATLRQLQVEGAGGGEAPEAPNLTLRDMERLFAPLARLRRTGLAFAIAAEHVEPVASPVAFRHAVLLLLLEALERSPAGAQVRVGLEATPADIVVTLSTKPGDLARALEERIESNTEPAGSETPRDSFAAIRSALDQGSARIAIDADSLILRWPRGSLAR